MINTISKSVLLLFVCSALAFSGSVTGKINFKGNKPVAQKIKMQSDQKCLKIHAGKDVESEQCVVNSNNTLRWVFVRVKKGLEGKKFPQPKNKATISQEGCTYHPHVLGVMVNQPLEIVNNDPTMHNIHALPKNSPQFNVGQPMKGQKTSKTFTSTETMVKIKCDVHSWMGAWVGVLDNPYYGVSDESGTFTIKDLPAGNYELEAWHETLGTQTIKVTVGAADTKNADFTFQGK